MKNSPNVVTVDKKRHARTRVLRNPDLAHARELNVVAVTLREFGPCANNFPVVFIKNPENGRMRPVAVFGFRPGENLFYDPKEWHCTYAPQMLLRHPFVIGFDDRDPDSNSVTTCLETDSPWISKNETEGDALYDESGAETDFLKYHMQLLADIFNGEKFTEQFMQKLNEMSLICPFEIILQSQSGDARKLTGLYTVDEKKLRRLDKEQLLALTENDYLANIYFMLNSLHQFNRLIKLRNKLGEEFITGYRIELKDAQDNPPAANE